MRKMLSAALLVCMVALLSMLSMPTVLAKPNGILKCELSMEINWDFLNDPQTIPSFIGTVSGDINGDLYIYLMEASYPGKTEHFSERWKIVTADGVIEGFDEGVWSFHNLKWVANGRVTSATGAWSYLVGANFQYSGTTTPVYGPPDPVYGTGRLHITPRP